MSVPTIFDMATRARRRDRAAPGFAAHDFLHAAMADELIDRLADVRRDFRDALVSGCPDDRLTGALAARGMSVTAIDPGAVNAARMGGVRADEDALPFAAPRFDLILSCGTLDSVNDVPGALLQLNRALRPDGLLLAAFAGAGSLPRLRAALLAGDGERPAQRLHPQIDVRAAGDLLARAGFAMPVADTQELTVRYGSLFTLMADLRGMGAASCLASPPPPLGRAALARAAARFAGDADPDGRTPERFVIVHMSGWKADPSQPRPARRGSATASLAEALRAKG